MNKQSNWPILACVVAAALLVTTICGSGIQNTAVYAEDAVAEEVLAIKGEGVETPLSFTRTELVAMTQLSFQQDYTVTNNFPTTKKTYRKGISLRKLLLLAGINDAAKTITFTSSDGYTRTFTVEELLEDARYVFDESGNQEEVEPMIAYEESSEDFSSLADTELVLTMGQRTVGEQTNPWFVKYLQTIEVGVATPEQWSPPTFQKSVGSNGVTITPVHTLLDTIKIYYTTDGTNPTLNSSVYNVSATYYQPKLNLSIVVTEDTEIRAMAVGAGKKNSEIATTAVVFGGTQFTDLGEYPWAKLAIESLAEQNILNGIGGTRFAPEQTLTRAQFATMMVLSMNETPSKATTSFTDVTSGAWYYGYVVRAAEKGWISGYSDGSFRPNQTLSREEMTVIVVRAMGKTIADATSQLEEPFANETEISGWARPYVAIAEDLGLIEHGHMAIEHGAQLSYSAQAKANRAEAAVTVYRMREAK